MVIEGTRTAFLEALKEKNIHLKLGVSKSTVSHWKKYAGESEKISLDKMTNVLIELGAKVVSDIKWELR